MFSNYLNESLLGLLLIVLLGFYLRSPHQIGEFITESQLKEFSEEGIVMVENLFTEVELEAVIDQLMQRVKDRPEGVRAEDLLNLHFNDSYLLGR